MGKNSFISQLICVISLLLLFTPLFCPPAHALDLSWGGNLKVRGFFSFPDEDSLFKPVGTGTFLDGYSEFRINKRIFILETLYVESSYEAFLSGGDTRRKSETLKSLFPSLIQSGSLIRNPINDRRRFMDLTKSIDEGRGHILTHRLDRLSVTYTPDWGTFSLGRQVVTWGNGIIFNPMDLLNPFAPTDIDRDYKVGDDMVSLIFLLGERDELQILYVPRRNPESHRLGGDQYSVGAKVHVSRGEYEFDFMTAKHFKDAVIAVGATGYLKNAAWRVDGTWTFLDDRSNNPDYLSLVGNIDYSWQWGGKNVYGALEFYFNGLGNRRYGNALLDPDVTERLERGELFVLGRPYLSGLLRVELHPLFNAYFTVINNISDPSGVIQPRVVWDFAKNLQMMVGGNFFYGGSETEFGGFTIPGTTLLSKSPESVFLWLTTFF